MSIHFNQESQTFHLCNGEISYIMKVLKGGHLGQLYYGKRVRERENYDCEFLTDKGCSIYEVRPLQCRTYPFWPHVFDDKALFEEEKKACPGLGKGELRSAAEIREGIHSTLTEKLLTIVK